MCISSSELRVKQQRLNIAVQHLKNTVNPMTKARLAEAAVVAALEVINEIVNRMEGATDGEG